MTTVKNPYTDGLNASYWTVSKLGYQLEREFEGDPDSEWCIACRAPWKVAYHRDNAEPYNPMAEKHRPIFREFAGITTKEDVHKFATKYGLLGLISENRAVTTTHPTKLIYEPVVPRPSLEGVLPGYSPDTETRSLNPWERRLLGVPELLGLETIERDGQLFTKRTEYPGSDESRSGEKISAWLEEAQMLRSRVKLWEILTRDDGKQHSILSKSMGKRRKRYESSVSFGTPKVWWANEIFVDLGPEGELSIVSDEEVTYESAVPLCRRILVQYSSVPFRQFLEPTDDGFELRFKGPNLRQAIWGQFFLAIAGNPTHRVCPGCGNLFEPTRSNQKTCRRSKSTACNSKVYREKKKAANARQARN